MLDVDRRRSHGSLYWQMYRLVGSSRRSLGGVYLHPRLAIDRLQQILDRLARLARSYVIDGSGRSNMTDASIKEWLVADAPQSSSASGSLDPQEAAYRALHHERELLERELTLVQQQQQFGSDPHEIETARDRESYLLRDLDRLLTMIRAAEVRRKPDSAARRWQ